MKPSARLKPVKNFKVYRRNLPHYEHPGNTYFITFRTINGFILDNTAKDLVLASFKFHDGTKYSLHACVIMNDHVHCILQPLETLEQAETPVPPKSRIETKET